MAADNSGAIAAAFIGAGGVLITAIAGFIATTRTARATAQASTENTRLTLEAERQYRLWEQRAKVYAEALAYANHRAMTRENLLRGFRLTPEAEKAIEGLVSSYNAPNWFHFEARLRAFSSDTVHDAFIAAHEIDNRIARAANEYFQIAEANRTKGPAAPGAQEAVAALQAAKDVLKEGADADRKVAHLIRDELQNRPLVTDAPRAWRQRHEQRRWWQRRR